MNWVNETRFIIRVKVIALVTGFIKVVAGMQAKSDCDSHNSAFQAKNIMGSPPVSLWECFAILDDASCMSDRR